jgi:hypothetical protein
MSMKGGLVTKKGTPPNASWKPRVPGSGKNRPAKGYDPVTKTWYQGV